MLTRKRFGVVAGWSLPVRTRRACGMPIWIPDVTVLWSRPYVPESQVQLVYCNKQPISLAAMYSYNVRLIA